MPRNSLPPVRENEASESIQPLPVLREPRFSQSLERGLAIMGCFSPEAPVLGISQLADRLGMTRSTTHRYVITLVELGYLERVKPNRQYRLALGVTRLGLGAMSATDLCEHARPLSAELWAHTGFTVSLAVLDGSAVRCVDRILGARSGSPRQPLAALGLAQAAHTTALGKLLLAYLPHPARNSALGELTLSKAGRNTITNKRKFAQELGAIHEAGIATEDEELMMGLVAIAVPVRNYAREVVAAVGLSASRSVIAVEALAGQLSPHLIAAANRLSARLGFRRADEPHHALGDLHGPVFEDNGA
jgi:IclR family transcriptional regulator, pca regulon regulatory protein